MHDIVVSRPMQLVRSSRLSISHTNRPTFSFRGETQHRKPLSSPDDEVEAPIYDEPEMPIYDEPYAIAKESPTLIVDNIAYASTGTERNINTITTSPNNAYGVVGREMHYTSTGN